MNSEIQGYLLDKAFNAICSLLLKVKDHADFGFLESLKRTPDLLLLVSIKYIDVCILAM